MSAPTPPPGMRQESLYYKAYFRLRRPLVDMLFRGVSWDREAAEAEKQTLSTRKDQIKKELDVITNGKHLYALSSRTSDDFNALRVVQRGLKAEYEGIPKTNRKARREFKPCLLAIRAALDDCRAEGRHKCYTVGDGLSDQAIGNYLFGTLGIPAFKKKRKSTGKTTITVEDIALKKIKMVFPERGELVDLILEHRRCNKLISTYLNGERLTSPVDGRFHSMYKPFGTQTGRLSSSSDPWGFGGNAQNQDRDHRWLFVPDHD